MRSKRRRYAQMPDHKCNDSVKPPHSAEMSKTISKKAPNKPADKPPSPHVPRSRYEPLINLIPEMFDSVSSSKYLYTHWLSPPAELLHSDGGGLQRLCALTARGGSGSAPRP